MLQVTIRASGVPRIVQAMPQQNIGEFLIANGIDSGRNALYINGAPLTPSISAQSFAQAGYTNQVLISSVVKTANA